MSYAGFFNTMHAATKPGPLCDALMTPVSKSKAPVNTPTEDSTSGIDAYTMAILDLPEATSRPRTAVFIGRHFNASTMSPEQAAHFLAGLPDDEPPQHIKPTTEGHTMTDNPRLKRKVEIRAIAMEENANQGNPTARQEARKLNYALRVHRESAMPLPNALRAMGIDPDSFI